MLTLELEIPDEASQIPGLRERISWFVEEQIKISRWRKSRDSAGIEDLVEGAFAEAERFREDGMSPNAARNEFVRQWKKLGE